MNSYHEKKTRQNKLHEYLSHRLIDVYYIIVCLQAK